MIVGTGFSGSTLLSLLLDSHPRMVSVGETQGPYARVDPREYLCSCGRTLPDCPFWRRVRDAMQRRGFVFGADRWDMLFQPSGWAPLDALLTRSLRSNALDDLRDRVVGRLPPWSRRIGDVARRNEALVDSLLEVAGADVLVDASKDPARARHLERLTALRPCVLHLVRDAPGYVCSYVAHKGASIEEGVAVWRRMAGHVDRLFARLPEERRLRVRYEDLCADPRAVLGRISDFAGLEPPPWPLEFHAGEHHVIGNQMRFATSSDIRLDERWRERFAPDDVRAIVAATAEERRDYGYPDSPR